MVEWVTNHRETLVDRLASLAEDRADEVLYRFLTTGDPGGTVEERTFEGLCRRTREMAAGLREELPAGARVLLLCGGGLEFVDAFWACLHAGLIAVPAYPPEPSRWHRTLPRLRAVVADADVDAVLMDRATAEALAPERAQSGELSRIPWFVLEDLVGSPDSDRLPRPRPDDVAYLQYTSGSTGTPKGVIVSHGNLTHTCADMAVGWRYDRHSRLVSWLPTFHDLGLIWGLLLPVHIGFETTLMQPVAFLQRPLRWLQAITAVRGTHTAAPNFAYDLCVRKVRPTDRDALDLSSVIAAMNAAEPVRASTMEAFIRQFEPVGFKPGAMCPCFGMAEATLKVTSSMPDTLPTVLQLDTAALEQGLIEPAAAGQGAVSAVGCGRPALGTELAIVSPETGHRCAPNSVGEIWLRGPGVAGGYWNREEVTRETFGGIPAGEDGPAWLRTGDLGFLCDGELFVTGRLKDMIIIRGRNLYPQDLELAIEEAEPRVRPGCLAAFAQVGEGDEGESLCIVAEAALEGPDPAGEAAGVIAAIRHTVLSTFSIVPRTIVLIAPRAILKTSSGKIMRRGTRQALERQELEVLARWDAPDEVSQAGEEAAEPMPALDRAAMLKALRSALAEVVPGSASSLGREGLTFELLGLDSVRGVELAALLSTRLEVAVPPTLIFDHPSLEHAADYLLELSTGAPASARLDEKMLQFAESALHARQLTALLHVIVDSTCQMFGAERGTVFLYDASTHELYSRVATADSSDRDDGLYPLGTLRLPADRGLAGHALTTGTKVHVSDVYADPRFDPSHDARTGYRTRTIDAVPLISGDGKPMGVLQLLNREEPSWSAQALRRLDRMAQLGAEALERTLELEAIRARSNQREPIAIVAMACRFPGGVERPEALWDCLQAGRDCVGEVPSIRWDIDRYFDPEPGAVGKTYTRWGGFLGDVSAFDASFFGISPREARSIDPQQRLLLETTTELFERAGWPLESLNGSNTGVFIGICGTEYQQRAVARLEEIDPYSYLGTVHSATVGRLSYWLGLEGPNVPVDTACSSSLVAVHLAVQALRNGECTAAIAGGVNLLLEPSGHVYFSHLGAMSPTGRCRTFSADADGYVRSEGCGVVLLERLSDARAAGHEVLAVIRGSAVNQDGRSTGFTAPNGSSQQQVIRAALAQAGVPARSVSYVECHGTGTALGDPIEVQALAAAYGEERAPDAPLWLGSIKSNIGHTEGAAGIAGLIKAVLCLQHSTLPASLHIRELNQRVPWDRLPVEPLRGAVPWRTGDAPRRAGVSAFGFSGTNCHAILEEAPPPSTVQPRTAPSTGQPGQERLVLVSGHMPEALKAQALRLAGYLEGRASDPPDLEGLAYSLAMTRSPLSARLALVGRPEDAAAGYLELRHSLAAFAREGTVPVDGAYCELAVKRGRNIVFVYPGQGSQWLGMGSELLGRSQVFREVIEACDAAFIPYLGWSIRRLLRGEEDPARPDIQQDSVVQPALFSMAVGLTALWRSQGVSPSVVLGHSQGEIAAACCAGCLSVEDAVHIIVARTALLAGIAGAGAMVAVQLSPEALAGRLRRFDGKLSVAVVNGPSSVVVSGDREAARAFMETLEQEGLFCRWLPVEYASHGPHVDPLLPRLREQLAGLAPMAGEVAFLSTVRGQIVDGRELTAGYWVDNLRQPVRLDLALTRLLEDEPPVFVEVSPHPVLNAPLRSAGEPVGGLVTDTLQREQGSLTRVLRSLARLWAGGAPVQLDCWFTGVQPAAIPLPTYAFQRERFWIERLEPTARAGGPELPPMLHPMLGYMTPLAGSGGRAFTARLSVAELPFLADHTVFGQVVVPGAALVELVHAAAQLEGESQVQELSLVAPLTLPSDAARKLQLRLEPGDVAGEWEVTLHSSPEGTREEDLWTLHATGRVVRLAGPPEQSVGSSWPPHGSKLDISNLYQELEAVGLGYGPAFQGLAEVWRSGDETVARVALPEGLGLSRSGFNLHPTLLDASLHALAASDLLGVDEGRPWLPFAWHDVWFSRVQSREIVASLRMMERTAEAVVVALTLATPDGRPLGRVGALHLRRAKLEPGVARLKGAALYQVGWLPVPLPETSWDTGRWHVLGPASGLAARLGAPASPDLTTFLARCSELGKLERLVVDLTGEKTVSEDGLEQLPGLVRQSVESTIDLLQRLMQEPRVGDIPWIWVTRAAVSTSPTEGTDDLARAALWGLLRSARAEHPDRVIREIDLDRTPTQLEDRALPLLLCADLEPELAWRIDRALSPRLEQTTPEVAGLALPAAAPGWSVALTRSGSLDDLRLVSNPELLRPLEPGEVRVEMQSIGVNFLDVVRVLGMVQLTDRPMLGEGTGRVLEVGPGVVGMAVDDRVMGLMQTPGGNIAVADARFLARVPDALTSAQAATIPVNFLTALYALQTLAGLKPRERILIHAAAGGTGMAAVQIAQLLGAEVFATASHAKWPVLYAMGLPSDHVASSRDTGFVDAMLATTKGQGVDVVLNALAGEFVDASLRLLPRGGRFLEMGKTDIRDAGRVRVDHPGVDYRAFDLLEATREHLHALLQRLSGWLERGLLHPLPLVASDIRYAPTVLKTMANGQHIGKLVLELPKRLEPEGTVLVTGGLGELGRELVEHLVRQHGVRHLLLTSRHGTGAAGVQTWIETLKAIGAEDVRVADCDVGDREQLASLLSTVPAGRPLTGVFHLAGLLDDGALAALTPERISRVLRPKVLGAWNLHQLTSRLELGAFVLFSSAAGVLGSAGQASYGAANAFLDGLATWRRARGMAACSLAWGLWRPAGQGMTAHLGQIELERLRRQGVVPLSPAEGMSLLDAAFAHPAPALVPAHLKLEALPTGQELPSMLRDLRPRPASIRPAGTGAMEPELELRRLPVHERGAAAQALVSRELAAVLGLSARDIPARKPFDALGLDSLMRVELRNRLARRIGQKLPGELTYEHNDVERLGRALLQHMALEPDAAAEREPAGEGAGTSSGPAAGGKRATVAGEGAAEHANPRSSEPERAASAGRETSPAARARAASSFREREEILRPHLEAEILKVLGRGSLDPGASLRALGVDEILGAELCLRIYRNVGVRVFPREILDCRSLAELTGRVAGFLEVSPGGPEATPLASSLSTLDGRIRSPFDLDPGAVTPSEQEILFILSPPRSGSTLLRVMLAGHSRLFAPQELHLTGYADMASYDRHLRGTALNMGILNVIGEVTSQAGAWNLYREWVRDAVPTPEIMAFIQARIGDRILVDKSPFFFDPLPVLLTAARRYPKARFLHLVRHPVSCIDSYLEQRFHAIFEQTRDVAPMDQAEWCWTRVHQGILEFQKHVPADRFVRVFFEDIATAPERTMRRLCPALGLSYEPAVLSPYTGHRMVSGGFQIGDPNFSQHRQIVSDKSEAWQRSRLPRALQAESLELATLLGYEMHPSWAGAGKGETSPLQQAGDSGGDTAMGGLDLEQDTTLLDDLVVTPRARAPGRPPERVLLTGATGFLGAFLLSNLLEHTRARIFCLVRASSPEEGLERIRRNLAGYGLWDEGSADRIEAIPGDLERDGLGLEPDVLKELRELDAIYHCAARISWLMPYRLLRQSNVLGMTRMATLAARLGGPPLHVVSSLGASFVRPFQDQGMVNWTLEKSGLGTESIFELPLGYMETKWVVDRLVERARARGLTINRYSPGLICGHSETGIDSLSDSQFVFALIKGSAQLGSVPDGHGWRFCPVDVVARAVVTTSLMPDMENADLCVDSTTVMNPADLVEVLTGYGYEVKLEPYAAWRQKVLDLADRNEKENALYAFTDTIFALTPLRFQGQRLQMEWHLQNRNAPESARRALEPRAHLHRTLLLRMVDYYVRLGEMPTPQHPPRTGSPSGDLTG